MLTLVLGKDWTLNRGQIMNWLCDDIFKEQGSRVLMVPELISHETERLLCALGGDTASRFAEVLSFSRLAKRVSDSAGHGAPVCLDDGGRVVAMAAAVHQIQSRLKYYAAVGTKPEFLTGLVDGIDEFKRCCVTSNDLMRASRQSEGSFAQKLEELALILESYDSICGHGKLDPRDQMTWLLAELEESDYAREHVFYVDGFPDFTRQHMAILEHLIAFSPNVTVSLNCDVPDSRLLAFEKAGDTAMMLLRAAKRLDVEVRIVTVDAPSTPVRSISQTLFQGTVDPVAADVVHTAQFDSVHKECYAVAERILSLVHDGCRFRDISVVLADMAKYRNVLNMVFSRCGIPLYISGTDNVLEKPVIKTVVTAIEAAVDGFEQSDVLRYARTMLSPLDAQECDLLENYVILWGISGKQWLSSWTKHPDGLDGKPDAKTEAKLTELNSLKRKLMDPLFKLRESFIQANNVSEQTVGLYRFLEEIQLADRLQSFAQKLDLEGDNRNAQILNQLWDILVSALEQLHDVLGHTAWDRDVFSRLFKLLVSQYTVGTIPTVLDAVTAGPVSAMRCQEPKHLFVLGAQEGAFPSYGAAAGILTDPERISLRGMGVPLSGGAADGLQVTFSEIHGVFCGAKESVYVTCSSGQPSFIFQRLRNASSQSKCVGTGMGAALFNRMEASAYLSRKHAASTADELNLTQEYQQIQAKKDYSHGLISNENIQRLYGRKLMLSASQIDKQADCRMAYFLKYGLRAKERKSAEVDPAEFGTYVHYVLERTAKDIVSKGGFHSVSKEESLRIAGEHAASYIREHFGDLDSERVAYLFRRNYQELTAIVQELWAELHESEFAPVLFEMHFGGTDGAAPAINLRGNRIEASVRGVVDRIDFWKQDHYDYVRVVDYKTGKKDFDYCDVFNGLGLQMLLYLFALKHARVPELGEHPLPAGVQYFPARAPFVSADGRLDPVVAAAEREKNWKRKGLLLRDDAVLQAMEPKEKPVRIGITRKKDGSISGDLADIGQFSLLEAYVYKLLGRMVDEIASGNVTPNPYTRGSSHNACWYCPYTAVCHQAEVEGRRNYERMTAERFWDEVEKEMNAHG